MADLDIALAKVDDFVIHGAPTVAWRLDRAETLARIRKLLEHPDQLNQRGLNACAPAVLFRIWFARDPIGAAEFSIALLRDGSATMGSLTVSPCADLLNQDYAALRTTTNLAHANFMPDGADWMLLSALRDSENSFFDYLGEPGTLADAAAGITLPGTLVGWLSALNFYATVSDETSVVTVSSRPRLLGLIPTSNIDAVLFVSSAFNSNLNPMALEPTNPPSAMAGVHIPNHYILLTAPFAVGLNPAWIKMDIWTWGRTVSGWVGTEDFFSAYFGLIVATTP